MTVPGKFSTLPPFHLFKAGSSRALTEFLSQGWCMNRIRRPIKFLSRDFDTKSIGFIWGYGGNLNLDGNHGPVGMIRYFVCLKEPVFSFLFFSFLIVTKHA